MMACCMVGAKPLSEPILEYWKFEPQEQILSEILSKIHISIFILHILLEYNCVKH